MLSPLRFALLLLAAPGIASAPRDPVILQRLLGLPLAQRRQAADSAWQRLVREHQGPIVEPVAGQTDSVDATFVLSTPLHPRDSVYFIGGPTKLDSTLLPLAQLPGTDWWYRTYRLPSNARFLYRFAIQPAAHPDSVQLLLDPLNPKTESFPITPDRLSSRFDGPRATSLTISERRTGIAHGTVTAREFRSALLNRKIGVQVYLPPGYSTTNGAPLPLVVLFDGQPYSDSSWVPTPTIADNLIADQKIRPAVILLVDNPQTTRRVDMWLSDAYADFVATELIPWARDTYHLSHDPAETITGGSSLGGLTAAFVAVRHPDIVASVISQSGSYWTGRQDGADQQPEWLRRVVDSIPRLPVTFWMEVGRYESVADSTQAVQVPANRRMHAALVARGYTVFYREFNGGHEYVQWRASLPEALTYFLGNLPR